VLPFCFLGVLGPPAPPAPPPPLATENKVRFYIPSFFAKLAPKVHIKGIL
jgi:hypothetical protein